ncbi:maltose O-acetyltransferase [Vibrio maritimus]|uniref:Maltose O-acetyltransferase n=2 Tax=Vibrio TaxID=662 RepID=A0A090S2W5_9VIBR|nr:maltose O-acetyltransferase [Vibrio maritimus]
MRKLYFYIRCIPKTLWFNFYYFSLKQAILCPVLVSHRTCFREMKGKVIIPSDAKFGKIKLGFGEVQLADGKYSRFIWSLKKGGIIHFGRGNKVGTGCRLYVAGNLTIGDGVNFTGEATIVCEESIEFGDRTLVSWGTLFMDTDMHAVENEANQRLNPNKPIKIGSDVWVCAKVTILKGSAIQPNSIVSAAAVVVGQYDKEVVLAGNPAKVVASMEGKTFRH